MLSMCQVHKCCLLIVNIKHDNDTSFFLPLGNAENAQNTETLGRTKRQDKLLLVVKFSVHLRLEMHPHCPSFLSAPGNSMALSSS